MTDWSKLQSLADNCTGWQNLNHCWIGEEEDVDRDQQDWLVGADDESGERYPVMTVDTCQYDAPSAAEPLAKFYAAANPSAILALIADLQRLEKARATDAGMIMDMTRDIVSVGEALGIPGEEQEGGVGEFIEAIEQLKQTAPDFALRARVADLLHLLQHAKISCPSVGDAAQALVVLAQIRLMLGSQPDQPAQQPVAYQKRIGFHGEWMDWEPCTKECFDHFAANPVDFWQTRALYAVPPAPPTDGVNWRAVADEQRTVIERLQARLTASICASTPAQQSQAVDDVLGEHRARRQQWQDDYEEYGPDNAVVDCAALLLMEVAGIPAPPELDFNEWLSQEERSKGDREKLISACTMILAEIEFMDRASAPGDTVPLALEPAEQQSAWVEQVMEQAQVFASAWSLVGGPFDTGNGLEQAEEEKERLRALLGSEA